MVIQKREGIVWQVALRFEWNTESLPILPLNALWLFLPRYPFKIKRSSLTQA